MQVEVVLVCAISVLFFWPKLSLPFIENCLIVHISVIRREGGKQAGPGE